MWKAVKAMEWQFIGCSGKMRELIKPIAPSLFWNERRPCVIKGFFLKGKKATAFWKIRNLNWNVRNTKRVYPNE